MTAPFESGVLAKGYAAKEGDARRYHPGLRPPVENREMELNHGNGMKVSSSSILLA